MKNLIERTIDVMIQKNWLNVINREVDKYNHYAAKLRKHREVANALVKRYNEIYGSKLTVQRNNEEGR